MHSTQLQVASMLVLAFALCNFATQTPAAPPITHESLVGNYDGGQMEVAAQLDLKADGHFESNSRIGALGEEAKGTWELKDGAVLLTTSPLLCRLASLWLATPLSCAAASGSNLLTAH